VYESNSYSLRAALKQLGIDEVNVYRAEDTLETLRQVMAEALQHSDVVFLTGGVSVGDYDFVAAAAEANGIEKSIPQNKATSR
jgi:molybdopterin molybdotransferase